MINFRKIMTMLVVMFQSVTYANAESTIYIFQRSVGLVATTYSINNKFVGTFNEIKKAVSKPHKTFIYSAGKQKCILKSEGKAIVMVSGDYIEDGETKKDYWMAEIQVNLTDGSVHYIKLSPKGFNNCQLKEIKEEEALKLLKDDKYSWRPEYIEE